MKYILKEKMEYNINNECPIYINFSNVDCYYEFSNDNKSDFKFLYDKYDVIIRNFEYHIMNFSKEYGINVFGDYNIYTRSVYKIIMG